MYSRCRVRAVAAAAVKTALAGLLLATLTGGCAAGSVELRESRPIDGRKQWEGKLRGKHGTFEFQVVERSDETARGEDWGVSYGNYVAAVPCPDLTVIQVGRSTDPGGHTAVSPSEKARQTKDGWAVDKADPTTGPYYPIGPGGVYIPGLGSNGSTVPGSEENALVKDGAVAPPLQWPIKYEFIDCIVCRIGPNEGVIFDCIAFEFSVEKSGKRSAPRVRLASSSDRTVFDDAAKAWNTQAAASGGTQPAIPPLREK